MKKIEIEFIEYKQIIVDIVNLSLPKIKLKYEGKLTLINSILNDVSLGFSSENYIYLKRASNEINCSIELIINKAKQLVLECGQPNQIDYYQILEVKHDSTYNEIRDNWIRLVKENHPDFKGDKGIEITKELNEAYNILSNEKNRSDYDILNFNFVPLKVNGSNFPILENRKFLLVFSFFIVLLLGFLVNGFVDNPNHNQGSIDLSVRNSEGLSVFGEIDDKKIKERYRKEVDSIYSKYNSSDDFDDKLSVENEENDSRADINEVFENFVISEKSEPENKPENNFNITKEEKIDLLTTENQNELNKSGNENDNSKNEIKTKSDYEVANKDVENVKKENDILAASKTYEKNQPSKGSLFTFVSDYVSAYKNKDFNKMKSLFSESATENGKEWNEIMKLYESNFRNNEIIRYDIIVRDNKIVKRTGQISGDFTVVYKKNSSENLKSREGIIKWELDWVNNSWKISKLNYKFKDKSDN